MSENPQTPEHLPYVIFERTVNPGVKRDRVDKRSGEVVQKKEHQTKWVCVLANHEGELHTWATPEGMQMYLKKGYKLLEYGNFDKMYERKQPNDDMIRELRGIESLAQNITGPQKQLAAANAEIEELRKRLGATEGKQSEANQPQPDEPQDEGDDLEQFTVAELKQIAKDRGIEGSDGMKKAELIAALKE